MAVLWAGTFIMLVLTLIVAFVRRTVDNLPPSPLPEPHRCPLIPREWFGAGFLAIIAVIPSIVSREMQIPFFVSSFLGGTGLLIVVSVGLDLIQRIEANLLMRNYKGFHESQPKIRSSGLTRRPSGA